MLKRLMVHVAGFNLGLVMRKLTDRGTPKGLAAAPSGLFGRLLAAWDALTRVMAPEMPGIRGPAAAKRTSATGC
jgi:hypothetical protein